MTILISIIFVSCGRISYADGNIMSMNINGQDWKAEDIDQNIVVPIDGHTLYDFYIGGNGALGGFSIRIELDQHQLHKPIGRYPIYSSYPDSKSGQVYLLPNFDDFYYYNESYASDSLGNRKLTGYLVIKSAKLEQLGDEFWYSELSGTFESQFMGNGSDGEAKEITITNGYFNIQQAQQSVYEQVEEPLGSTLNGMTIRLDGRDWNSDRQDFSMVLTDDQLNYSAVLTGEQSGMDMDENNRGWIVRLFFDIPKKLITDSTGPFFREFLLGPIEGSSGQVYFENGELISLESIGKLELTADFKEVDGEVNWNHIKGEFDLQFKDNNDPVKGTFILENDN